MTAIASGDTGTAADTAGAPPRTHREITVAFIGLATALFLAALDQTIVATAAPTIVGELGGLEQLSWVVTSYLLTSTVTMPLYGKVSDLYGRKPLYRVAIGIFVAGSVLCGVAGSMPALIAARALQGVGAGGLMVLTQTIIGDLVSPRERGRYMGYLGAVFGVSSVAGPLLGGYFVDHLTWRLAFFINVPLGAFAWFMTQRNLRLPHVRRKAKVDWLGAAVLAVTISALLLATVWGGTTYPWGSAPIVGLFATAVAGLAAFVAVERRATEPVIPLELFRSDVFRVAGGIGFITGVAMFGSITFLPVFLQIARGATATSSGLLMVPLVAGLLTTNIGSGRLISRWGRYRPYPIAGTGILAVGMGLLSAMDAEMPYWLVVASMVVVGVGIGLVLQVVILAVQNAVPMRHLGAATSSVQFFRAIGGAIGVAAFGALFNANLSRGLAGQDLALSAVEVERLLSSPAELAALPDAVRAPLATTVADALTGVFAAAIPVVLAGFVLAWLLREVPLRTSVASSDESLTL